MDLKLPLDPASLALSHRAAFVGGRKTMWKEIRRTPDGQILSVRKLAALSNLSPSTIMRYSRGDSTPSLRTGLQLARAIGISPWRILAYFDARRAYDRIYGLERPAHPSHPGSSHHKLARLLTPEPVAQTPPDTSGTEP